MTAVEWGTGQVFWSLLWFSLVFLWIVLVLRTLVDLFANDGVPGWGKALWILVFIGFPFLGVLVYLAVYSAGISERENRKAVVTDDYYGQGRGFVSNDDWQVQSTDRL